MESSALNVAHQQHRRAENHTKYRRFDDAILCHKQAAEKLREAMDLTKVPRSLESLRLQQDYHNRQEDIIRTMEEADSLFDLLLHYRVETEDSDCSSRGESDDLSQVELTVQDIVAEGTKRPKDDRTVIEELRTLNHQLRSLVVQLVTQLDACTAEADILRERVRTLEAADGPRSSLQPSANSSKGGLHVVTDSLGGNSSPFVFSPCGELSPDVPETRLTRELPVLAPLEMPTFDFSGFMRHAQEEN